jgi:hypothetical protein
VKWDQLAEQADALFGADQWIALVGSQGDGTRYCTIRGIGRREPQFDGEGSTTEHAVADCLADMKDAGALADTLQASLDYLHAVKSGGAR